MESHLIFDIGFHKCEDTAYFLAKGHHVIAVDADIRLVDAARTRFADSCESGRLQVIHAAVTETDGDQVEFHISRNTVWSSINPDVAGRRNSLDQVVSVPTRRLDSMLDEFGTPYYCKIDIEGQDVICLKTLVGHSQLPQYISVESECGNDTIAPSETEALATIRQLRQLGYEQFKLVDQPSLEVIDSESRLYDDQPLSILQRLRCAVGLHYQSQYGRHKQQSHARLQALHDYPFPFGASGPFGDDLDGQWIDGEAAESLLIQQRRQFFAMHNALPYGFWCDWHARRTLHD